MVVEVVLVVVIDSVVTVGEVGVVVGVIVDVVNSTVITFEKTFCGC